MRTIVKVESFIYHMQVSIKPFWLCVCLYADFTVKVLAEDDNVLTSAKPSFLSMKLWKADTLSPKPPARATSYQPDKDRDHNGVFRFTWVMLTTFL